MTGTRARSQASLRRALKALFAKLIERHLIEAIDGESVKKSGVGECRRLEGCLLRSLSND